MKKILSLLAIVALSAPVIAQQVNVTAVSNASSEVTIGYTSTDVAADELPAGIALKVTATGGMIDGLVSFDQTEFPVYLDYAYSEETTGGVFTNDPWEGQPLAASESLPGKLDVAGDGSITPTDMVIVCMGRLTDPPSAGPAAVANLVTLHVACDGGPTSIDVALESTYRGGIVSAKAGTTLGVVMPATTEVPCGCATCKGDLNGDGVIKLASDLMPFIAMMQSNGFADIPSSDARYNLCLDMNGDGKLALASDLMPLIATLQSGGFADVTCP